MAVNRDPTLHEYTGGKPTTDTSAYVMIHSGGTHVTPEKFMSTIQAIQPELYVALADEVAADATKKRTVASVDRTVKWLDACLELQQQAAKEQQQQQHPQQQQHHTNGSADDKAYAVMPQHHHQQPPHVFAPIVGGALVEERERAAKAVADKRVAGFALCGFGTGESPCDHHALISAATQHLPQHKPRLLAGLSSPEEVLVAVAEGIDLFDCSYATHATANGYALSFPLSDDELSNKSNKSNIAVSLDAAAGLDDTKLNLWATQYRLNIQLINWLHTLGAAAT
eukprot:jgi/Chrzof1/271/Cz01g09140.t1